MSIKTMATLGDISTLKGRLSVIELATKLGVHPDTIRRWEKKGRISCVRHPINGFRLFLLSDLIEEVMQNESKSSWLRARVIERTTE